MTVDTFARGEADIFALGEPMVEFNQTREGGGLRELWSAEGVDHGGVRTNPLGYTAVYFVNHDDKGHHFSFFRRGSAASLMRPADLPADRIAKAKVLHLSGISAAISESACETCFAAVDIAKSAGVKVSFDTNLRLKLWRLERARDVMSRLIAASDICLPSFDDVSAISGLHEPQALLDWCLGLGAKQIALKLGERGAMVDDGARRTAVAPHPCRPVDATGAGDTFAGSLLARVVAGDDFVSAARYATVAAALSTEGYGAVEPIPNADRVRAAMKA